MDVTGWLLQVAARTPHVLVVAVPGNAPVRLALEAAVARRGWQLASAPADADILAVAGSAGPRLGVAADAVWRGLPAPRARVTIPDAGSVDRELDKAVAELGDRDRQRRDASGALTGADGGHAGHEAHQGHPDRAAGAELGGPSGTGAGHSDDQDHAGEHGGHADHDERADHVGHGAGGGHGGHGGHGSPGGHAGHGAGMEMPGGLPMADLGEDRDGLTLDQLHVPLGPVLPDWPAGLVVRVTLQGDVIQQATAEVLDAGHVRSMPWPSAAGVTRELDGLARFLAVAGWGHAAAHSRRLRDELLAGSPADDPSGRVAQMVRRVRRSRTLRWLIRGIPAGPADVAALLDARLDAIEASLSDPATPAMPRPHADGLPEALGGAEFAAARLIIAALDPDSEGALAHEEARHG